MNPVSLGTLALRARECRRQAAELHEQSASLHAELALFWETQGLHTAAWRERHAVARELQEALCAHALAEEEVGTSQA